jgi:hypothetical protein
VKRRPLDVVFGQVGLLATVIAVKAVFLAKLARGAASELNSGHLYTFWVPREGVCCEEEFFNLLLF